MSLKEIPKGMRDLYADKSDDAVDAAIDMFRGLRHNRDERLWALYRTLDVTQGQLAKFRKATVTGEDTPSQSFVSKRVKTIDEEIVFDGSSLLRDRSLMHPDDYEGMKRIADADEAEALDAALDAHRDILADAITRLVALDEVIDPESSPPEWLTDDLDFDFDFDTEAVADVHARYTTQLEGSDMAQAPSSTAPADD